jgi:hypothetical protein
MPAVNVTSSAEREYRPPSIIVRGDQKINSPGIDLHQQGRPSFV